MANLYAVHFNPKHWIEARKFKFDRFLSKDRSKFVKSEHFVAFGVGKRTCPGESMAMLEVLLYTVSLIQRYNILPESGLKFEPVMNGFLRTPPHGFKLVFEPRKNSWYFEHTLDTLEELSWKCFPDELIFSFHNLLTSLHDEFLIGIKVYFKHSSIIFSLPFSFFPSLSLSLSVQERCDASQNQNRKYSREKLSFKSRFGFIYTQHFHSVHFSLSLSSSSLFSLSLLLLFFFSLSSLWQFQSLHDSLNISINISERVFPLSRCNWEWNENRTQKVLERRKVSTRKIRQGRKSQELISIFNKSFILSFFLTLLLSFIHSSSLSFFFLSLSLFLTLLLSCDLIEREKEWSTIDSERIHLLPISFFTSKRFRSRKEQSQKVLS